MPFTCPDPGEEPNEPGPIIRWSDMHNLAVALDKAALDLNIANVPNSGYDKLTEPNLEEINPFPFDSVIGVEWQINYSIDGNGCIEKTYMGPVDSAFQWHPADLGLDEDYQNLFAQLVDAGEVFYHHIEEDIFQDDPVYCWCSKMFRVYRDTVDGWYSLLKVDKECHSCDSLYVPHPPECLDDEDLLARGDLALQIPPLERGIDDPSLIEYTCPPQKNAYSGGKLDIIGVKTKGYFTFRIRKRWFDIFWKKLEYIIYFSQGSKKPKTYKAGNCAAINPNCGDAKPEDCPSEYPDPECPELGYSHTFTSLWEQSEVPVLDSFGNEVFCGYEEIENEGHSYTWSNLTTCQLTVCDIIKTMSCELNWLEEFAGCLGQTNGTSKITYCDKPWSFALGGPAATPNYNACDAHTGECDEITVFCQTIRELYHLVENLTNYLLPNGTYPVDSCWTAPLPVMGNEPIMCNVRTIYDACLGFDGYYYQFQWCGDARVTPPDYKALCCPPELTEAQMIFGVYCEPLPEDCVVGGFDWCWETTEATDIVCKGHPDAPILDCNDCSIVWEDCLIWETNPNDPGEQFSGTVACDCAFNYLTYEYDAEYNTFTQCWGISTCERQAPRPISTARAAIAGPGSFVTSGYWVPIQNCDCTGCVKQYVSNWDTYYSNIC